MDWMNSVADTVEFVRADVHDGDDVAEAVAMAAARTLPR